MKPATDVISPPDAPALLREHNQTIEHYFQQRLVDHSDAPPLLIEAVRYSLLAGGKRLRPTLVLESFHACGGDKSFRDSALAAAAAMELIHTFSLVHDDLPSMDDDDLRRGLPTNHKVFGEAMAILAGDAMVTLAFEWIARFAEPGLVPQLIVELAAASGPAGMIGGQVLDMDSEGKNLSLEQLRKVHRMKTGALLTASCRLGAVSADASHDALHALSEFGRHVGLAFQIIDDVLDVTSTPEQLGKATNKDASRGKNTYPALLGLEKSQTEAQSQLRQALASLEPLGSNADGLRTLARYIVEREH